MSFLHLQLALAGFACVAIPIVIHLLMRRRRKPVMWGAMRFLLEAYRKQRRKLMLEKWLLLLTRCLLVAAIAAAIARPLVGELLGGSTGRTLYIIIDNSLAAQAVDDAGQSALDRHKQAARQLLDALSSAAGASGSDRAAIITLAGPPDGVVLPPSADLASVRGVLESLEPADAAADIPASVAAAAGAIDRDRADTSGQYKRGPVYAVILSDFLTGSADTDAAIGKFPADVRVFASQPSDARANVGIIGVEPERSVIVTGSSGAAGPGAADASRQTGDQVRVMLRRSGGSVAIAETTSFAVSMLSDDATPGAAASRGQVRWSPGQETTTGVVQLRSPVGSRRAATGVSIIQAVIERSQSAARRTDAIAGDNTWRRALPVRESLRVGIVSPRRFGDSETADRLDPSDWVRLALRPGDLGGVELVDVDPTAIDGARLAGLDAVVLPRPDLIPDSGWQRLRLFIDGGGLMMVFPAPGAGAQLWTDPMARELGIDLKLAREPRVFGAPEKGERPMTLVASSPTVTPTDTTAADGRARDLLSLIRGEIDELARPVSVWQTLPIENAASARGTAVLSLADGSPFVWAASLPGSSSPAASGNADSPTKPAAPDQPKTTTDRPGDSRGLLVYVAAALDLRWTDLAAKPLIVPLVQELVREGVGQAHGSWSILAGTAPFLPTRTAELRIDPRSLRGDAGVQDAEHEGFVAVSDAGAATAPLRRAGLWRAVDDRGSLRALLAVNPDPRGGRTEAGELAGIQRWLAAASPDATVQWISTEDALTAGSAPADASAIAPSAVFTRAGQNRDFSLAMLILALVLGLIELALARWSSHASVINASDAAPGAMTGGLRSAIGGAG